MPNMQDKRQDAWLNTMRTCYLPLSDDTPKGNTLRAPEPRQITFGHFRTSPGSCRTSHLISNSANCCSTILSLCHCFRTSVLVVQNCINGAHIHQIGPCDSTSHGIAPGNHSSIMLDSCEGILHRFPLGIQHVTRKHMSMKPLNRNTMQAADHEGAPVQYTNLNSNFTGNTAPRNLANVHVIHQTTWHYKQMQTITVSKLA